MEWITAATDDADLIKGPGQLLKRRDLKKINKLDHVVYKYEMGVQNLFHLKLATNFMPDLDAPSPKPDHSGSNDAPESKF